MTRVVVTSPRHSSASKGLAERATRTIGEQLRTSRYDMQNRYNTRIAPNSVICPSMVRYSGFCVTRYACGASGTTPFRAVYDRDYTQEIVPLAGTILVGSETPSGSGIWLGKSETNLVHIVGSQWRREQSEDWNRRNAQKHHCCSRYKEYPGTWYQTHRVVGDARNT